jgi:hypothetical protein
MSALIMILIVVVVLALVMWLIYYLPMPPGSPLWIKNFLYVLVLLVAILVIIFQAGVIHAAQIGGS